MQVDIAKTSHSCAVMRKILQNHDMLNTWERCPVPKLLLRSYDFMNDFVIRISDNTMSSEALQRHETMNISAFG